MTCLNDPLDIQPAIARNLVTVAPDATAMAAIVLMRETGSNYVLVVDENGGLIGILTERDLVRISTQPTPLDQLPIHAVMSHPVITVPESALTNINAALTMFQEHQARHLPVLDDSDRVVGIIEREILTEILAQHILQSQGDAQREEHSEERWQLAFEGTNDGIWDWDLATNSVFFSNRWKAMRGFGKDEVSDRLEAWFETIHPYDYERFMAAIDDHFAGSTEFFEMEYRARCKDGFYLWFLVRGQALRNESGEVIRMSGSERDITQRKQSEESLRESERRYSTLASAAPVAIFRLDTRLNCVYVNNRWSEMTGRPSESAMGRGWIEALHPDDRDRLLAQWTRAYAQATPDLQVFNHGEGRHLRPDGSINWFYVHASREVDAEGKVIGYIGTLTDITDRKQTEAALQESQRFIQKIADASPNILYLYDIQEQRNVYTNREIFSVLGYSLEAIQAMGKNFVKNLMHPDDLRLALPKYYAQINAAQDGEIVETEYRMRHINGEWRWLHSRDYVFSRDANGQVKQSIGTAQDVTNRKYLEQTQNRLIAILEASTDYILIAEVSGQAIWNNTALKQLRCLDSDAAVTQQMPINYHPQWVVDLLVQQSVPTAIANGSWLGETALLDSEGREIPVSQLLLAHKSPQGEVEFFSTIMRDMRVQKEYEQRLELSNAELLRATRLKDEFLATMSHELRTPLNSILGMTEALQEQIYGSINENQLNALQTVERSGSHLLALIDDILDMAKIESGQLKLDCTPTVVASLCQSSIAFIKQQALKKRIQIEVKLPQNLPDLLVDGRRIRQVLINLLNNAVKFTPAWGRITLEVSPILREKGLGERAYLRFSVIDTGIGITPENIKKLFQPFIQIDSALNRQYNGTGLGLSLVKQIVELHGGNVGLTSEVGVGSCFTIELPYIPDPLYQPEILENSISVATSELDLSLTPPQIPLILVAEDDEANFMTVSSYLEAKGYRILLARNGQEAIALAKSHHPNLILMDIQMPVIDGLEATKQIRLDPDLVEIPIIALTALAMTGDREKCIAAGANEYLTKPVKLKGLSQIIQAFLVQRRN